MGRAYGPAPVPVGGSTGGRRRVGRPPWAPHGPSAASAIKGAPVLILSSRARKGLQVWDGRRGKAVRYAGEELGVSVPGKIVDVIARSWALAGDASGAGQRPDDGDLVICEDGTLGTVVSTADAAGRIDVNVAGQVSRYTWWAIVLRASGRPACDGTETHQGPKIEA